MLYYYRYESVNYLASVVFNAKLVVIHSGLDVVRVRLRRKDRHLHAAVHVCVTIIRFGTVHSRLGLLRGCQLCVVWQQREDHFLDWIDTVEEALST